MVKWTASLLELLPWRHLGSWFTRPPHWRAAPSSTILTCDSTHDRRCHLADYHARPSLFSFSSGSQVAANQLALLLVLEGGCWLNIGSLALLAWLLVDHNRRTYRLSAPSSARWRVHPHWS